MKLKVLGCGDAFATGGRANTAFVLFGKEKNILIDCGASTLMRMKQENISPLAIDMIVITHFHGDHYGGIPFLMISNKLEYDRQKPLVICGPVGVRERVTQLQEAMYPGTAVLFETLNVTFEEFVTDSWKALDYVEILAKQVVHSPAAHPHGVKVKFENKTFAFSGDTEWTDHLIALSDGSDLFVCECNNLDSETAGHLSYQTLAAKKALFNTKRLMINHLGADVIDAEQLEIARMSDGMVVDF